MLEKYTEIKQYKDAQGNIRTSALRTPKYREVANTSISQKEGIKQEALLTAIVQISTGKKFYVDPVSRADITDVVAIAIETGETEVTWKLAEEVNGSKWARCTLAEMQEARKLGLEYKGSLL